MNRLQCFFVRNGCILYWILHDFGGKEDMEMIAMFFLFKRHQTSPMQCFRRETEEFGDLGMLPRRGVT